MTTEVKKELQTDKKDTKECQCTFPGCETICIVNLFYAPYKARCSEHKGKTDKSILATKIATSAIVEEKDIKPNGTLAHMLCPICHSRMTIDQLTSKGSFITFVCAKAGKCGTVVQIQLDWAWAVVNAIPEQWKPFVDEYNRVVRQYYKDLKEDESAATKATV